MYREIVHSGKWRAS